MTLYDILEALAVFWALVYCLLYIDRWLYERRGE
jgi:hypothetical protein